MNTDNNNFYMLEIPGEERMQAEYFGVPFEVITDKGLAQPLSHGDRDFKGKTCTALHFLGMVTDRSEGSEWWGQNEANYYQGARVFIGDKLGRINIVYTDDTMDVVSLVYGVNVWNYDLVTPGKEHEKRLRVYSGPFVEPFASDATAASILRDSLVMADTDSEKCMKYVMTILPQLKPIAKITITRAAWRMAGVYISAITGALSETDMDPALKPVTPGWFVRKEYLPAMDKLARRLYQFRDDIPVSDEIRPPKGYHGPKVLFTGNEAAEIYTNVYTHNLHDMATEKVDADGMSHTSSKNAPNFGSYIGIGTYKPNDGAYYKHIWTRDLGRTLTELTEAGMDERLVAAADKLHFYLYDKCIKFSQPHWKRVANSGELDEGTQKFTAGKENDGHASVMLFIYNLYKHGVVGDEWLRKNEEAIKDAAGWFIWQSENPAESHFDGILYSESEASTQTLGGFDLFSNVYASYALSGYAELIGILGDDDLALKCSLLAKNILAKAYEVFSSEHPRFGLVLNDTTDDCWTWEYKRFNTLFLLPDIATYDPRKLAPEIYEICLNTYRAQKEEYFNPGSGRQMGYGQGYLTETAILLDNYKDLTACVEQAALFCYNAHEFNYIVPEGVIMHPSERYWIRNSDLGNAVQQAEIVKCGRLLIGLDDCGAALDIIPRLPDGWYSIEVEDYVITTSDRKRQPVTMKYTRPEEGRYTLEFQSDAPVHVGTVRFGPFTWSQAEKIKTDSKFELSVENVGWHFFAYAKIDDKVKSLSIEITSDL